jgi:hypothetical protein
LYGGRGDGYASFLVECRSGDRPRPIPDADDRTGLEDENPRMPMTAATISDEYRKLQTELHRNPEYGVASLSFAPIVAHVIRELQARTVADYGAGKKNLLVGLKEAGVRLDAYYPYDPVFPEYGPPRAADLVCCIDVLEHIEPDRLENVLAELARITVAFGFFSIHMEPADKVLADGRNAHLIQQPSSWWLPRLTKHFEVLHLQSHRMMGAGIWLIVKPRQAAAQDPAA